MAQMKKSGLHVLLVFSAVMAAISIVCGAAVDRPDDTYRYSTITVPMLPEEPVIDGVIDEAIAEWAAIGPRFHLVEDEVRLTSAMVQTYFGYTGRGLYIAWRMERPEGYERPVATVIDRGEPTLWRKDDFFELMLDAVEDNRGTRDYYLAWNFIGTRWDRRVYPTRRQPWFADWLVASNDDFKVGWEGEAFFPFEIFEHVDAPEPGDLWRFFFFKNRLTPYPRLELFSWPYGRPAHTSEDYAHMIFGGDDGVFTRVIDSGLLFEREGQSGLLIEIVNPAWQRQDVEFEAVLYRRRKDAPPGTSYLQEFEETRDRPGDVEEGLIDLYVPDDRLSEQLIDEYYEVVEEKRETLSLDAGSRMLKELVTGSREPAGYLIIYDVRYPDNGAMISGGPLQFEMPDPMGVELSKFFLVGRKIEAIVDLRYVPGLEEEGSLQARFLDSRGKGITRTWSGLSREMRKKEFEIPLEGLKAGDYRLELTTFDKEGKETLQRVVEVEIPETPEWFAKPVAAEPFIPRPWIPIEVSGGRLSMLMGTYVMEGGPFPDKIKVRSLYDECERELLREPVSLAGRIDGAEVSWGLDSMEIIQKEQGKIFINTESSSGNTGLKGRTTVEYDGFMRFDIELFPLDKNVPVEIEELYLNIPMKEEFSRLYNRGKTMYPTEAFMLAGAVPEKGLQHPWTITSWIGNEERGLMWFAENVRGWRLDPKYENQAIELVPANGGNDLRINLFKVEEPFSLHDSREITFGIMFTPPGPKREELIKKEQRNVASFTVDIPDEEFAERERRLADEGRVNVFSYFDYFGTRPKGWPLMTEKEQISQHKRRGDIINELGGKVIAYAGWWLPRDSLIYQDFGAEMTAEPRVSGGLNTLIHCHNTPYADIWVYRWKERMDDVGVDGYRMDASFKPMRCYSLAHSGYGSECGWIDDDGSVRPSFGLFAAREASKRSYGLFRGLERDDGICGLHHNWGLPDPRASHADFFLNVEGPEREVGSLRDWPLEYFRARIMGEQYGKWIIYLPKADNLGYNSRRGLTLLHNMIPRVGKGSLFSGSNYGRGLGPGAVRNVWKALEWFEAHKPEGQMLLGYWDNSHAVNSSEPESIKITLAKREGEKVLLTALNMDRKPLQAEVRLDLAELGFSNSRVYAMDIIEPRMKVAVDDGGFLNLTFLPEGYRYLALSSRPFDAEDGLPAIPESKSENLFREPEAASWDLDKLPHGGSAYGDVKMVEEGLMMKSAEGERSGLNLRFEATKGENYLLTAFVRVEPALPPYCSGNIREGLRMEVAGKGVYYEMGSSHVEEWYPLALLYASGADEGVRVSLRLTGDAEVVIKEMDFRKVSL